MAPIPTTPPEAEGQVTSQGGVARKDNHRHSWSSAQNLAVLSPEPAWCRGLGSEGRPALGHTGNGAAGQGLASIRRMDSPMPTPPDGPQHPTMGNTPGAGMAKALSKCLQNAYHHQPPSL